MLYVYVTKKCQQDTDKINIMRDQVRALRERLEQQQNTSGLERYRYRPSFLKKRFGQTRLIIAEVFDGEDVVLCFLRHVHREHIRDYRAFLENINVPQASEPSLSNFLHEARATPILKREEPSSTELEYINIGGNQGIGQLRILESSLWTNAIRTMSESPDQQGLLIPVWEVLIDILDDKSGESLTRTERVHNIHRDVNVRYRHFPANNTLLLIAPLGISEEQSNSEADRSAIDLLSFPDNVDETRLLRNAARAYPGFILYDRDIWRCTQESMEANLALSPEESDVLSDLLNPDPENYEGFPLFINGRPGSGKSTILQYLFSEYLHTHLACPTDQRLSHPPLYLTYNKQLLEDSRKLVEDIFRCGAEKLEEPINLQDEQQRNEFDRAFVYFREFLLLLLDEDRFDQEKYVDFHRFHTLYSAHLSRSPISDLRRLTPEVAWHTVRTYIKGKRPSESEFFDPESYAELPKKEITVTPKTFKLVWEKVWDGWYRGLCEDEGHWDDQDLARRVLDKDIELSKYPVVFCDEAQDFTTVELELIFRLSLFSTKHIDRFHRKRIPYAFAGDPFQTLNPTGFRWDAIKANFHDNIARQLDPDQQGKVSFTFKELAYNYRSTTSIVRFCNLIQLKRAELFDITDVSPQKAWAINDGACPAYFELNLGTKGQIRDQSELVIIVPCQEGGEKEFIKEDEYLKKIALDKKGEIARNVLSPMRAKGLEFNRVVLYKFGSKAVSDGHVKTMEKISMDSDTPLEREHILPLEYFFNGVYVGASRAKRRLLVVEDTGDEFDKFWRFATGEGNIESLLTENRQTVWDTEDLLHMLPGKESTWSADRDNPKALAEQFFEQGKLEKSTYLLQLAHNQYADLNMEERALECTALIHDIEKKYPRAATIYKKLNKWDEAIRCYWEARSYDEIREMSDQVRGRFNTIPFVVAARFGSKEPTVNSATEFITDLSKTDKIRRQEQFKYQYWPEIIQTAISTLAGTPSEDPPLDEKVTWNIYCELSRMRDEEDLRLDNTQELALLAFNAMKPDVALEIWGDVKRRTGKPEPEFIIRAKGQIDPYPERLQWYAQLKDNSQIVAEYKMNSSAKLEDKYRRIIVNAAVVSEDYQTPVDLVKNSSWDSMQYFLKQLPDSEAGLKSARILLWSYLQRSLEEGGFRKIIEYIKLEKKNITVPTSLPSNEQNLVVIETALTKLLARSEKFTDKSSDNKKTEKKDITVLASLLSNKQNLVVIEAALIKLLARSEKFADEFADESLDNKILASQTIQAMAKKEANKLKEFVTSEEIGAALERVGYMVHALEFYESIFRDKYWTPNKDTKLNAQKRWLKCKERQDKLYLGDKKRKDGRFSGKAKENSVKWGLQVPEEEFPVLNALELHEIDSLLENISILNGAQDSGLQQTKALGRKHVEKKTAKFPSWPLPSRPASADRIEFSLKCGDVDLWVELLPKERKLVLIAKSSRDSVTITVINNEVRDSNNVQLTPTNNTTWGIEEWSLNISLKDVAEDMTLIDLFDSKGGRVLCLAI